MTLCDKGYLGSAGLRRCVALMLAALLIITTGPAAPVRAAAVPGATTGHIQPVLLKLAAEQPEASVRVIVQMNPAGQGALALTRLGVQITRDLPMIHAVVAQAPAKALPALAAVPGVRWVSLDGAVRETMVNESPLTAAAGSGLGTGPTGTGSQPSKGGRQGMATPQPTATPTLPASTAQPSATLTMPAATAQPTATPVWSGVTTKSVVAALQDSIDVQAAAMPIDTSRLANVYNQAVRATNLWNEAPGYLRGQNVTLAVIDSGMLQNKDIGGHLLADATFHPGSLDASDHYGHGTFVATLIGSDGKFSGGQYMGIAPYVDLINARVGDDQGTATESDVVAALQWVLEHKAQYNIRIVNLSLNSSISQSYHESPLDAAVEILWFNGIVVVVSAGNSGTANLYPPANDPFVITVGATDDQGTVSLRDDVVAGYSAYGMAETGPAKPDLVAPGTHITAILAGNRGLGMAQEHPGNSLDDNTFRMSGTSMSAPMVSGAAALLLQDEPGLTPDQVKYRLKATANRCWPGYDAGKAGAGYLDAYAAVHGATTESANQGLVPSRLLGTGTAPLDWPGVDWSSVQWNSVQWNSVQWNSVQWNSVQWNSVQWNSVQWKSVQWSSDYWGS